MIYRFIDSQGTFVVDEPHKYNLYFPLTNKEGSLLSSISPNLAGDIKRDNQHFLMAPASIEDLRSNLLARREFFVKTDSQTIRASYPYQDRLEAGFLYHKIVKKIKSLEIEILNFVPFDSPVEVMRVRLSNKSNKAIKIIPTSFIPLYARAEKNLRDHRHVTSLLNRVYLDKFGLRLKPTMIFDEKGGHKANETIYYVFGFEDGKTPPGGQFPTLDYFYGQGDIVFPDAIEKNVQPAKKNLAEFAGKESCAAFRFREKILKKSATVSYFLIMGLAEGEDKIKSTFERFDSPDKVEESFEETKKYWRGYLGGLEFDFKDRDFNNWLLWVKLQPTLRKLFGCSFLPHFDYGKGARGWRDLWQDALTLVLSEPEKARSFILNNFKGVRIDGSNATLITKDGQFISDRNRISRVWMDHGIWPYLTLCLYINKTGDLDILLKEVFYFQDHQYKRAKEIDPYFLHKNYTLSDKDGKPYTGSILEHILIQGLTQFFNVGRHNIIRLESADWNDGLDMAPEHGESVAFSFMYAHNLRDLCQYLEKLKGKTSRLRLLKELIFLLDARHNPRYSDFEYKQKRLDEYLNRVRNVSGDKIELDINELIRDLRIKSGHLFRWLAEKEWLKQGFFNGYYDNKGRPVEGKAPDGGIRMLLPSQVFAIMSTIATKEQIKKTWLSIKKHLQDKELGGFRLNTNFNSHHHLDLGRAFGFSYGDKENGAFFSHMVVMLANALYRRGFVREGFEVINSIYKMATHNRAKIYPSLPEYFNNQGRGLYLYLTGSASWYIHTLLEEILGLKFDFGDIYLEPKLAAGNFFKPEIETRFSGQGKALRVSFIPPFLRGKNFLPKEKAGFVRRMKKNKLYKIKEVYLRDRKIMPEAGRYIIKKEELNKAENVIKVYLK